MANATKRGNVGTTPFGDYITKRGAVSTAQVFYPNSMIGLNTSGYADKLDDAAQKTFDGVLGSAQTEVLSGGSNGDVLLDVIQPRFITVAIAAATVADIGKAVYASDDQTVSLTPGTFGNRVGTIHAVISATSVVVLCSYTHKPANQVLSGDGAVTIKEGVVVITKGSAAAVTIADPTATVDDFKELSVISATAFAHTLSNGAGSGFNAGGAASDLGTFGGAKGDGIRLIAYQGKWYVQTKTNVTLA
jgi:hypothetical protein